MQGASAFQEAIASRPALRVKIFTVWERVVATDLAPPSSAAMALIPDRRASQFWDSDRLVSLSLGEKEGDRQSIVWDWVAIYRAGKKWKDPPDYSGRPVISVIDEFRRELARLIE